MPIPVRKAWKLHNAQRKVSLAVAPQPHLSKTHLVPTKKDWSRFSGGTLPLILSQLEQIDEERKVKKRLKADRMKVARCAVWMEVERIGSSSQ